MTSNTPPRILAIAGSDSGGGAGIQADIKTITLLGGFAMTAVTAVTAQNTLAVVDVQAVSVEMVVAQIRAVVSDIGVDVVKTGMLPTADMIDAVCDEVMALNVPLVLDPVMVSTSGDTLMDADALDAMKRLVGQATLVTPNIPEAAMLAGMDERSDSEVMAGAIMGLGAKAVLVKGGHRGGDHLDSEFCHDDIYTDGQHRRFTQPRVNTAHTHGTGCTLAAAIATLIGLGFGQMDAVMHAQHYVHEAIKSAPQLGQGHGPLEHRQAALKMQFLA